MDPEAVKNERLKIFVTNTSSLGRFTLLLKKQNPIKKTENISEIHRFLIIQHMIEDQDPIVYM